MAAEWIDKTLYTIGEIGGYLAGAGLIGDAVYHAAGGEFELAALEGVVGIYAGVLGYSSGRNRRLLQDYERVTDEIVKETGEITDGPLADLRKSIRHLDER